jgi:branched-chain amino acid transport system permease protein
MDVRQTWQHTRNAPQALKAGAFTLLAARGGVRAVDLGRAAPVAPAGAGAADGGVVTAFGPLVYRLAYQSLADASSWCC